MSQAASKKPVNEVTNMTEPFGVIMSVLSSTPRSWPKVPPIEKDSVGIINEDGWIDVLNVVARRWD